jgi:uncharacterized protein YjbJ (UPF0337 family)
VTTLCHLPREVELGALGDGVTGNVHPKQELNLSIFDKLTGRAKKAAGDLSDDASLRQEGRKEEAKGDAKERKAEAQETADAEAARADRLERET